MSQPRELITLQLNLLPGHMAGVPEGAGDMNEPQVSLGVLMNREQLHSPPASLQRPPALCKPPGLAVPWAGTSALRHSTGDHHSSLSHAVWHKQIIAGTKVVSVGLLTLRGTNHKRVN